MHPTNHRSHPVGPFATLPLVLLAALLTLAQPSPARAASAALDVTLRTEFPVVNSGDWAVVEVNYSCSSVTNLPCADVVITSVLPPQLARAASDVQLIGVEAVTSYSPATNTARWAFAEPLNAGSTGTFELRVRFAPGVTADGTEALLRAEVSGSNAAPAVSNLLPLTARATPRARADKRFVSGGVLDLPTLYQVEVCVPNATSGALDLTSVVISDTLPLGARFDSASDGGVYDPASGTVVWPPASILVSAGQSCARRTLSVTFLDAAFNVGDEVRNEMSASATALGGAILTLIDSDIRLIQPPTPGLAFGKSGPAQARVGETIRYSFAQSNTGTTPLTDLSLVDQIPPEVQVSRIYAAGHNQAALLRLRVEYQVDQSGLWQELPGSPYSAAACVNVAPAVGGGCAESLVIGGATLTALRWTYLDPLPYGWQATGNGSGLEAAVVSAPANQIIVNRGDSSYTFNGYSILDSSTARTRVVVDLPGARPSVSKAASPSVVYAGDEVLYTLTLRNNQLAGFSTALSSPQIADRLVPELAYVADSQRLVSGPAGAPAPSFLLLPDFRGGGRTLLRWSWPGYSLAPGQELKVSFRARVAPFTAAGQFANSAQLAGWSNDVDDMVLSGCSSSPIDTLDYDDDGNTQERLCGSSASNVSLAESAGTDSLKLVKGQLDSAWSKDPERGLTVPGGRADYTLTITNTGTVALNQLVLVDILPWLGDMGVIRLDQQRETEWRPFLVAPIVGPSGSTVFYSTQANPCRQPDLGLDPDAGNCQPAAWSTAPPADITAVQSFKIDFGARTLSPDEAVTVAVRMRAPYGGEAGEIAWNSFGYRARELGTGAYLLAAEPPRVGIERQSVLPPGYGDFVWLDQDEDNLQGPGEPGLNGVRVELFRDSDGVAGASAGDTFVDETITGPHDDGRPGFYLFSHPDLVPPGDYYARFTPPLGYGLALPDAGADDRDSDVDLGTRLTPVTTLAPGEVELTWDAGLRTSTAVGNYIWLDRNYNGLQDEPAEAGLNGVGVSLRRADGSLVGVTLTADDPLGRPGYYLFDELAAGDYYVEVDLPAGFSFATADQGDDAGDSDVEPTTGSSATFSLSANQYDPTRDVGLTLPAGALRLGNLLWLDRNGNGRYDPAAGERGIDGARLSLFRDSNANNSPDPGEHVGTATTASRLGEAGWYEFAGLAAGSYLVAIDLDNFAPGGPLAGLRSSEGNLPTPDPDDNADDDDNGDLGAATIASRAITLGPGEPTNDGDDAAGNQTLDFGLVSGAALGNYVWFDVDADGLQEAGEPPVPGVTVELLDGFGTAVMTTTTDSLGGYGFGGLSPGDYSLRFSGLPAGHSFTARGQGADAALDSDPDPADGTTGLLTLAAEQTDLGWDAGLVASLAGLGDRVWDDLDRDGVQDAGEPGLNGVAVQLFRADGSLYAATATTTNSGADGLYAFGGLPPGDYYLVFGAPPAGYKLSPQNAGGGDADDSDADLSTRRTSLTTLGPGELDMSWDMGLYAYAGIGDRVWKDLDRDGLQGGAEAGASGVTVRLYRPGSSTALASATTDASGLYTFTNLLPGDYYLEFSLPEGYRSSPRDAGDDAGDSDPHPSTYQTELTTLAAGELDRSWDFGIYPTASIGDLAWLDRDADGLQEPGEPGVPGVQVVLYDSGGASIDSTVSDATGKYRFGDLLPGDYSLLFELPPTFVLSPRDAGANGIDSDVYTATRRTDLTSLDPGESDQSWDIGLYQDSRLGDYVWHDQDADGLQDGGEPGIPAVVVTLYRPGPDGAVGTVDDTLVLTDTTDAGGRYLFANLPPRDYYLQFSLPAGYTTASAPDSADADDDSDSDADPATLRTALISLPSSTSDLSWDLGLYNPASLGDRVWLDEDADGVQDPAESATPGAVANLTVELWRPGGGTPAVTTTTDLAGLYSFTDLAPGDYYLVFRAPAGYAITRQNQGDDAADSDASPLSGQTGFIALASGEHDPGWDLGLYNPASLGDRVWLDEDADGVQDPGESEGVAGVRVELLDGATLLDYTYSDIGGRYSFSDLLPGSYRVRFGALPAGYYVSPSGQSGDESLDSDADAASGLTTAEIMLTSGVDDRRHDLGLYRLAAIGDRVWHDRDADGAQDAGEPGVGGATVALYDSAGALISTTTTLASGLYTFTGVIPGDYYLQLALPAGYDALSPQDQPGDDALDSDADPVTRRTPATSLSSGESDPSWDMGLYQHAGLGDYVWEDQNGNGRQDGGEPGLDGVTVTLDYAGPDGVLGAGGDDTLAVSATTTLSGSYGFVGLTPGVYRPRFGELAGYARAVSDSVVATDTTDSDADAATGYAASTMLESGELDLSWDAGFYRPATLGDYVWEDLDGDGVQTPGEPGFGGVGVSMAYAGLDGLFGTGDDILAAGGDTTDGAGSYLFESLRPGRYSLTFTRPAGYAFTRGGRGDAQTGSDLAEGLAATATTTATDLLSGEDDRTWDAGLYQLLSLGDLVWDDLDNDGLHDGAPEAGIAGVTVTLYLDDGDGAYDAGDTLVATDTTDTDGHYLFADLTQGDYLAVIPAGNFAVGGALRFFRSSDRGVPTDVAADPDNDLDGDDNGVGPSGGAVGGPVASAAVGLRPQLEPADDGDADSSSNLSLDFGFYSLSVGNLVWDDRDNDGLFDGAPEAGLNSRAVSLYYDANNDGDFLDAGESTAITTTTTSNGGRYLFGGLRDGGRYQVGAATGGASWVSSTGGANGAPSGPFEPGHPVDGDSADGDDNGTKAASNTARSAAFVLMAGDEPTGEGDLTMPTGVTNPAADSSSNLSVDFGMFNHARIGNQVWLDVNGNGIQNEAPLSGVGGVTVRLYNSASAVVSTTTTSASGVYGFGYLLPGDYSLEFAGLPAAYAVSAQDQGANNATDSDVSPATLRTLSTTLTLGEDDTSWDLGLYQRLGLGDLLWDDRDNDGLHDGAAEPGIDGVTLELYSDDGDGGLDAGDTLISTTTTAGGGLYSFTSLEQGSYLVVVPASEFAADQELYLYRSSTGADGAATGPYEPASDPDDNLNSDDNGSGPAAGPVASAALALSPGAEPTNDGDASASTNLSLDLGFFQPLSLGNLVWNDLDNDGLYDGPDEPGLGAVRVELYRDGDGDGRADPAELAGFTTTAADGAYAFNDLVAGDYLVVIPAGEFDAGGPLAGFVSSTGLDGAATGPYEPAPDPDDNVDGDDNGTAVAAALVSAALSLSAGAEPPISGADGDLDPSSNLSVDFGLFRPAQLGDLVWLDADADGAQDAGEAGLPGVAVTLLRPGPDGLPGGDDDATVRSTITGATGDYSFAPLATGRYFVRFGLPVGFERSPAGGGGADDSDAHILSGDTALIDLDPGEHDTTWDAGLTYRAGLGNRVWLDGDANGLQDLGEPGVAGVTVTLRAGSGQPLATAVTDVGGFYSFPNLAPGDYSLSFAPQSGYRFSPRGGADGRDGDSDVDPATGATVITTIDLNEADPTWDAGLYLPVSLGNLVWEDLDNDGRLSPGEQGLGAVEVRLFADADADGLVDSAAPISTTTTSADGSYGFADLTPGRYLVEIAPPEFYSTSTGTPGAAVGPYEPAPAPDSDLDGDDNGGQAGLAVRSSPVTLRSLGEPPTILDGDDLNGNQSVDFGLFRPAALGSTVWYDRDGDGRQGGGESGVAGVTVTLYKGTGALMRDAGGRPISSATDSGGHYLLDHLTPGAYLVRFGNLPSGYTFTTPGVGDDSGDSDADPTTGQTVAVVVAAGQRNLSLWAGLINPTAIALSSFSAERLGDGVALRWETGAEWSTWSFYLYRSADGTRAGAVRITPQPILARGAPQRGASYEWLDAGVDPGERYSYWLQEVELSGATNEFGPIRPAARTSGVYRSYLPALIR